MKTVTPDRGFSKECCPCNQREGQLVGEPIKPRGRQVATRKGPRSAGQGHVHTEARPFSDDHNRQDLPRHLSARPVFSCPSPGYSAVRRGHALGLRSLSTHQIAPSPMKGQEGGDLRVSGRTTAMEESPGLHEHAETAITHTDAFTHCRPIVHSKLGASSAARVEAGQSLTGWGSPRVRTPQ